MNNPYVDRAQRIYASKPGPGASTEEHVQYSIEVGDLFLDVSEDVTDNPEASQKLYKLAMAQYVWAFNTRCGGAS